VGIEDANERHLRLVTELRTELAGIRDDIDHAKHWHDERLDQIWFVLFHAGLLHEGALHEALRDLTDKWGRIEGCPCCAENLAREPFVPWPEKPHIRRSADWDLEADEA